MQCLIEQDLVFSSDTLILSAQVLTLLNKYSTLNLKRAAKSDMTMRILICKGTCVNCIAIAMAKAVQILDKLGK